jgi:hypothetical protein
MQHHILEYEILNYITAKTSQFTVLQHDCHYGHAPRQNEVFAIYPSATHSTSLTLNIFGFNLIWESNNEEANSILAHICSP